MTITNDARLEIRTRIEKIVDGEIWVEVFYHIQNDESSPGPQIGYKEGFVKDLPDQVKVQVVRDIMNNLGVKGSVMMDYKKGPVYRSHNCGDLKGGVGEYNG